MLPSSQIKAVLLDIEGTVCPISFVKDELYPFFLNEYPHLLKSVDFPISGSEGLSGILGNFPPEKTQTYGHLAAHIETLVANDVKDPVLKQFQGFVWESGYKEGKIVAPVYMDALAEMEKWCLRLEKGVSIYSSGSVKAQKLLFGSVLTDGGVSNVNHLINSYFDTVNIGPKTEGESYVAICQSLQCDPLCVLFLSDNVAEVDAALSIGMRSCVVVRPGNKPLSEAETRLHKVVETFTGLM